MSQIKAAVTLFFALALCVGASAATLRIDSDAGISVEFDPESGHYQISARQPAWTFGGQISAPVHDTVLQSGSNELGAFREIHWSCDATVPVTAGIRIYQTRPVALFTLTCEKSAESLPMRFPDFTNFPADLNHFSHRDVNFAPPVFSLVTNGAPWLLFDNKANAAVISPADNFMCATLAGDGVHEIASGLNDGVRDLPAHFSLRTLLVVGPGINEAWNIWGSALTAISGKHTPANDADIGLRYLGYWTDNGAYYYYRYDSALGYAGTLEALVAHYRERAIPIRYLQLDSWWYYKTLTDPEGRTGRPKNAALPGGEWNRYGGLLKYEAHPEVLPDGLAAFQKKINLPLITHNRWIDPASPYHEKYRISGLAAVDSRWWDDIMGYISGSGVVCYEQDWLNVIYDHSPALSTTVDAGNAFADGMANAAQARNMSVQYCMAPPRLFLQGSRYSNLTTIRVSDDRFKHERWDDFLYNSQFAGALGIWPWTDVFMSTESSNLLLATLSAGMVGVGDAIGREDRDNLMRVARPDGVIVKPDVPIVPLDEIYLTDATIQKNPMVAWSRVDHGSIRTAYVFAYSRRTAEREASFTPASLGFSGDVCVFNARSNTFQRLAANQTFKFRLASQDTAFYSVTPITKSGLAFFGDAGKFVGNGAKRISGIKEENGALTIRVIFSSGEKSVQLFGFAEHAPHAEALMGTVGAVGFNADTGRFSIEVSPSTGTIPESPGGDPIQTADIRITGR